MSTFKLMRLVHETPDVITREIADQAQAQSEMQERIRRTPVTTIHSTMGPSVQMRLVMPSYGLPVGQHASLFFMNFWNMKQRGELHESETPAVWAMMMRMVDASAVVRLVLAHANALLQQNASGCPREIRALWSCLKSYAGSAQGRLSVAFVSKLRTNLCVALRACQGIRGSTWTTFDAADADLLLRACQTALEVKREDDKQWISP